MPDSRLAFTCIPHRLLQWALVFALVVSTPVRAEDEDSLQSAIDQSQWILDTRLRLEDVDQAGIDDEAHALTLRARFGVETGEFHETSFLLEGVATIPIVDKYRPDPLDSYHSEYPVVADPENYDLNRIQFTNTSLPDTTLTIGRQRINLDDQRFIGSVGWRQNEQTFDALRVVNKGMKNVAFDATWFNRVNRVFGKDSPQGTYRGNGVLLNGSYEARIGKLTGFGYLLEFDPMVDVPSAAGDSTSTWGFRFTGDVLAGKFKLAYLASWATQSDAGANPLEFHLDFAAAELTVSRGPFGIGAGIEVLDGDGTKGFTTPLATLHKFQGWADKFLATPANGIEDFYMNLSYNLDQSGPFRNPAMVLTYHDYDSEQGSADYGSEWNASLAARLGKFGMMIKYAHYRQGVLASATDTSKFWLQVDYIL